MSVCKLRHDGFGIAEQQGLGDLQFEPVRGEAGFFQRGGDDVADATCQELRGGQVHRNGQVLRPSRGGATRLPQYPRADLVDELQVLGNGNEYQRRDQRSVFRGQAYQRLEADEAALRYFEQRLVMQFEAIMQHRIANHPLEFESRLQFGVHLGQEEPDAIAAVGLGLVQRQIGAFQKPLRIGAVCRRQCNADADRGNERPVLELSSAPSPRR